MKTKKTKLTKFYVIEKSFDRYDSGGFSKGTVKADKIENVLLPEKFMYQDDDNGNPIPVSKYYGFCGMKAGDDFTKVNKTQAYLEMEESSVGIGTTPEKARAALQMVDMQGDDENWD